VEEREGEEDEEVGGAKKGRIILGGDFFLGVVLEEKKYGS
jgi:hypothetical protein